MSAEFTPFVAHKKLLLEVLDRGSHRPLIQQVIQCQRFWKDLRDIESNPQRSQLFVENIDQVLSSLSNNQSGWTRLRFGLDSGQTKTLREISSQAERSYGIVRQTSSRALKKLRHPSRLNSLLNLPL